MTEFHVGVTGTRQALPIAQWTALHRECFTIDQQEGPEIGLHHGCCTGTDEALHRIARQFGWSTVGHPGVDAKGKAPWRMPADLMAGLDVVHKPMLYRDRNHDITAAVRVLLAAPAHPEDDPRSARSGTWQTVRFAREHGRNIVIVAADGTITQESYCPEET